MKFLKFSILPIIALVILGQQIYKDLQNPVTNKQVLLMESVVFVLLLLTIFMLFYKYYRSKE